MKDLQHCIGTIKRAFSSRASYNEETNQYTGGGESLYRTEIQALLSIIETLVTEVTTLKDKVDDLSNPHKQAGYN